MKWLAVVFGTECYRFETARIRIVFATLRSRVSGPFEDFGRERGGSSAKIKRVEGTRTGRGGGGNETKSQHHHHENDGEQ